MPERFVITNITVTINGDDEETAEKSLKEFFENNSEFDYEQLPNIMQDEFKFMQ